MGEKEGVRPAHGCLVAVVSFQLIMILLGVGLLTCDYLHTSTKALLWRYEHGLRNFPGVYVRDASLQGIVLAGANLSRAILTGTDLSGADLSGADLSQATWLG